MQALIVPPDVKHSDVVIKVDVVVLVEVEELIVAKNNLPFLKKDETMDLDYTSILFNLVC